MKKERRGGKWKMRLGKGERAEAVREREREREKLYDTRGASPRFVSDFIIMRTRAGSPEGELEKWNHL